MGGALESFTAFKCLCISQLGRHSGLEPWVVCVTGGPVQHHFSHGNSGTELVEVPKVHGPHGVARSYTFSKHFQSRAYKHGH